MGKDDKNSIGWRIASRRQELHFTQAQLAEKTGVSIPTISNIESNKRIPSVSSLMRRQVAALDVGLLPQNKDGEVTVLLGVCEIDEKKVFAIWNAFYFVGHKTNRSCYVSAKDLLEASESGLAISSYSDTPVYVSTTERFAEALDKFIEVNCI